MKKASIMVLAIFIFSGCKSNPYPDGKYTSQRPVNNYTVSNWIIDAPDQVEFSEGTQGSFTIHGMVPPPGVAQISITGLPQGAVYSDVDQSVTWTPDYNAGNDPNKPNVGLMSYKVNVTLTSSAEPKTVTSKIVTLTVYDMPRSYRVLNLNTTENLDEGLPYSTSFQVEDIEAPNGPFTVATANAPDGIAFIADPSNPERFTVNFLPSYGLVDSVYTSTHTNVQNFNWTLLVTDSKGKIISIPVLWKIADMRQDPVYVGPTQFSVKSTELDFIFQAEDPNLEVEPTVTLTSNNSGKVDFTPFPPATRVKGRQPSQAFHVHWSNIPLSSGGSSEDLIFNLCVYDSSRTLDNCHSETVTVNFDFAAPTPIPTPSSTPPHPFKGDRQ